MEASNHMLRVHSIESFGTHDGPGIRLVIFLQGCNLRCKYCQNPDTFSLNEGQEMNTDDLIKRAMNMRTYFGQDGGVTVSGGEPMLQSKKLIPFFEALKEHGIHTNIDTNGTIITPESKKLISELSDLVMFDIKGTSEEKFKNITGTAGLKKTLENIALRESSEKPYWLRYVLVPGFTDSDDQIEWLINTFEDQKYLERLEILPYHKLGQYKWESLGMKYDLEGVSENTQDSLDRIEGLLKPHFDNIVIK